MNVIMNSLRKHLQPQTGRSTQRSSSGQPASRKAVTVADAESAAGREPGDGYDGMNVGAVTHLLGALIENCQDFEEYLLTVRAHLVFSKSVSYV